jgi:K+-transporting ATPase ATPase A chain
MKTVDILHLILFPASILVMAPVLGNYLARVYTDKKHPLSFLKPAERLFYRTVRINSDESMTWKRYALSVLAFSVLSLIVLFTLLVIQAWLPGNPQGFGNMTPDLAFNTAVSFVTNTNWQSYSGESVLSYFSQMAGLTVQNFVSAAVGMSVMLVLIRGLIHKRNPEDKTAPGLGNFWVDMTRSVLYILLPLALIVAGILVSQGVIQNLSPYQTAVTLEGQEQVLPMGPAASQIAIKQLGTNGGGFFGVNSAHPFENPTPFSNYIEWLSIILISAAFPFMYGRMIGKRKQGYVIFAVMFVLFIAGIAGSYASEHAYGTMEGKETRFGIVDSVLWSTTTTVTSNGSVNAMHDSLSPLAGGIALVNMMIGEVIFGGVGCGLYGMLAFVVIAVFICGLMVGRSPEYLGKKIESFEIKLAILIVILPTALALIFTSIAVLLPDALASRANGGPHGLSEILYDFASPAGNNGSAFAGLTTNTVFYNVTQAFVMLAVRFGIIFLILPIAGSFAKKKTIPESEGTFKTDTLLFGGILAVIIIIIGGLNFFPVMTLGPMLEHLGMIQGIAM